MVARKILCGPLSRTTSPASEVAVGIDFTFTLASFSVKNPHKAKLAVKIQQHAVSMQVE